MSLSVISIPPTTDSPAAGVVVGLHGWGANAEDLASLSSFLDLPNYHFVFPNAPLAHPYSSQGKMWYTLPQSPADRVQGERELAASQELLENWLVNLPESTKIPLERTVAIGFSQGGAMALDLGFKLPLAGLVVLSGYLHPLERDPDSHLPPILMVHGQQDPVVSVSSARSASSNLKAMGATLDYYEFDMGHEIRPQVLPLIKEFVTRQT